MGSSHRGLAGFWGVWTLVVAGSAVIPDPRQVTGVVAVLLAVSLTCTATGLVAVASGQRRLGGALWIVGALAAPTGYGYLLNIVGLGVGLAEVVFADRAEVVPARTR